MSAASQSQQLCRRRLQVCSTCISAYAILPFPATCKLCSLYYYCPGTSCLQVAVTGHNLSFLYPSSVQLWPARGAHDCLTELHSCCVQWAIIYLNQGMNQRIEACHALGLQKGEEECAGGSPNKEQRAQAAGAGHGAGLETCHAGGWCCSALTGQGCHCHRYICSQYPSHCLKHDNRQRPQCTWGQPCLYNYYWCLHFDNMARLKLICAIV